MSEAFDELQAALAAVTARDSVEMRTLQDKSDSEVARLLDSLKEALSSTRTDLAIAMGAFKADSLEAAQRVGMCLHQEDSRLTVRMGAFKTATENVKLRAISMFSLVLCVACLVVAAGKAKSPRGSKGGRATETDVVTEEVLL
jgi:hypothetical protein